MQAPTKLRILQVIGSLDPSLGGPCNVLTRLAAALALAGHEVAAISHGDDAVRQRLADDLARVPGGEKIRLHWLAFGSRAERILALKDRAAARELVPGFDVIHLHGVWEPLLRKCAAIARHHNIPYVITPHGMLDPWSLSQKRYKKRLALLLGYRTMLDHAGALHLLNKDEIDLIAPLKLRCPKQVVPNGIFLDEIDPLPPAGSFRARCPGVGDRPFVLFLGRLHYKKGLDHLASAFITLARTRSDMHLVVAGPDDGERGNLERTVAAAGLADRVHVVGPLYGRDKLAAYADASVFCLPSRQEGFSIAIAEAMACGLPCVITPGCHFPEVQEQRAGVVADLHPDAIAAALLDVLSDEPRRRAMGEAGRRLVEARYTWPVVAQAIAEVYRLLPARSGGR